MNSTRSTITIPFTYLLSIYTSIKDFITGSVAVNEAENFFEPIFFPSKPYYTQTARNEQKSRDRGLQVAAVDLPSVSSFRSNVAYHNFIREPRFSYTFRYSGGAVVALGHVSLSDDLIGRYYEDTCFERDYAH